MNTQKTTNKKAFVFNYILNNIQSEEIDVEKLTDKGKIDFLYENFMSEYNCAYNIKRYGSYQNMLAEWLKGAPSYINIDFWHEDIIKLSIEWGYLEKNATEKKIEKLTQNWFNYIAANIIQLKSKLDKKDFLSKVYLIN
jgi:hypothetical protein